MELGELDGAAALADDLADRGQALDRPFALATSARARGLLLAAHDGLASAQEVLERSQAEHDRLRWPFERARTLLALGGRHASGEAEAIQPGHATAGADYLRRTRRSSVDDQGRREARSDRRPRAYGRPDADWATCGRVRRRRPDQP